MGHGKQKPGSPVTSLATRQTGATDTVRVRVSSEAQARQLKIALDGAHPCEEVRLDGGGGWDVEIRTEKTGAAVSQLLTRVEEWLTASGTESATVFLDGQQYKLEPHWNVDRGV